MKKTYMNPTMTVVQLQQQCLICESLVHTLNNTTGEGISYGGAGGNSSAGSAANVKDQGSYNVWNDDWSE